MWMAPATPRCNLLASAFCTSSNRSPQEVRPEWEKREQCTIIATAFLVTGVIATFCLAVVPRPPPSELQTAVGQLSQPLENVVAGRNGQPTMYVEKPFLTAARPLQVAVQHRLSSSKFSSATPTPVQTTSPVWWGTLLASIVTFASSLAVVAWLRRSRSPDIAMAFCYGTQKPARHTLEEIALQAGLDTPSPETPQKTKKLDSAGAGKSFSSPIWVTNFFKALRGDDGSGIPIADAKLEDVADLLGGALFLPLYKWMQESGPIYRLSAGPQNFVIVSEPAAAQHVLKKYGPTYEKGLVRELSLFLFGVGFAVAEDEEWKVRRRAVQPGLHRKYISTMVSRVFVPAAVKLNRNLAAVCDTSETIDMEDMFSKLTLDIIGKALFDYDFDSLTRESSLIQAVYTSLKEVEQRAVDLVSYWKVPLLCLIDPRQRKAAAAVQEIRNVTDTLIAKCKAIVEAEANSNFGEEYVNEADPSLLRFLLESREEVSETQLRDDLLSMLVAGHETTGSVLTWTVYLLAKNPDKMALAQQEVDRVLGDRLPTYDDFVNLRYITRCINESMRLYPHPPVLIRRTKGPDVLPGGYPLGPGQDVMVSIYNIHHSEAVWGPDADKFIPERFGPLEGPIPSEANTDYRYIPFGGGPRKCIGEQFALLEAVIALAIILRKYEFELDESRPIQMTTGATIHTKEGLFMRVRSRKL